jgi:PPK2 family polyphosphate:nucleotide phosphotransferase
MKEIKKYRVKPGHKVNLSEFDPNERGHFESEADVIAETTDSIQKLDLLQQRLYAEGKRGLLIVLQAVDTGGKDGTIRHVMKGINPQGCRVTSFKVPTPEERAHDFLWRVHQHVPAKGFIGIFNRSYYEDVLVTRVHRLISDQEEERRFEEINAFERILVENGTTILKFYLGITRDEQRRRLQERIDDLDKRWKFSSNDLIERRSWNRYPKIYAETISATSTKHAPWFLIPANHKWYRNYLVAKILVATLEKMNPQFPDNPEGIDFSKVKIPA